MARSPDITVQVPMPLRDCCGGAREVFLPAAPAGSVRAALLELERRHPALHRNLCDETGAVRRHLNVFVNNDHVSRRNGLDTPLLPGDILTILPAVSGG